MLMHCAAHARRNFSDALQNDTAGQNMLYFTEHEHKKVQYFFGSQPGIRFFIIVPSRLSIFFTSQPHHLTKPEV